MRRVRIALATVAVAATTVGGAYAAGVVNKDGHQVDDHAAHGQSVAAAARAAHAPPAADTPTETPSTESTEPSTDDSGDEPSTEPAEPDTETPTSAPAEKSDNGHHYGQTKTHAHEGHHWGRGHGKGPVVKPDNPHKQSLSHPAHPAHPTH